MKTIDAYERSKISDAFKEHYYKAGDVSLKKEKRVIYFISWNKVKHMLLRHWNKEKNLLKWNNISMVTTLVREL